MDAIDPFTCTGRWLVVTASGAQHLIDSSNPDQRVTVVRVALGQHRPDADFELAHLRRDGAPLRLLAVASPGDHSPLSGITVGAPMVLTLEPLSAFASITLRRTTPVVSITPLDAPPTEHRRGQVKGGRPSPTPSDAGGSSALRHQHQVVRRCERETA